MTQPGSLAERLFRMREAAGLTGNELAARLGWGVKSGPPRISKIERGRQMPSANEIRAWAEATGHSEDTPELLGVLTAMQAVHVRRVRPGGAQVQEDYSDRIQAATRIRNLEIAVVPGLLQTTAYARSIFEQVEALKGAMDIDAAVQARMQRQQVLYDPGKEFEFLITEAALKLMPCPKEVMLGQFDRLLSMSMGNVKLGIIPFWVQLSMTPVNGFLLLDDQLTVETYTGEDQEHGDESATHSRIFDMLMHQALTGDEARRLIMAAAEQLRGKLSKGRSDVLSNPEPEHEPRQPGHDAERSRRERPARDADA